MATPEEGPTAGQVSNEKLVNPQQRPPIAMYNGLNLVPPKC